jgi:hypothetical protein
MKDSNRRIVKRWTWSATGLGLVLGPGVDALPLLGTWAGGYVNLAQNADLEVDESSVKGAIGTILSGFVQWYVSGKIAHVVVGALTAAGLALTASTAGFGILIAAIFWLGSNALINALFTYRFLKACATLLEDSSQAGSVILENSGTFILQQLMDLTTLGDDIKGMVMTLVR